MTTSNELLPCPCCGGKPMEMQYDGILWVQCEDCALNTAACDASVDYVQLWNRRATQPAAGEPVAWITRPLRGSSKGKAVMCQADHTPNLELWEKPFPVYAAPPAAAHGDSFRTWLTAEMPAGTVIGDPSWWAEHILKRIGAAAHWDEAVRKDAERYRWLRDYWIGDDPASINMDSANRRGLNAAIDAAMRAQGDGEVQ